MQEPLHKLVYLRFCIRGWETSLGLESNVFFHCGVAVENVGLGHVPVERADAPEDT